jgi:hypothetical protein
VCSEQDGVLSDNGYETAFSEKWAAPRSHGNRKSDLDARWIAAATLDRYLQRIGQPQVFGTQFSSTMENGQQI